MVWPRRGQGRLPLARVQTGGADSRFEVLPPTDHWTQAGAVGVLQGLPPTTEASLHRSSADPTPARASRLPLPTCLTVQLRPRGRPLLQCPAESPGPAPPVGRHHQATRVFSYPDLAGLGPVIDPGAEALLNTPSAGVPAGTACSLLLSPTPACAGASPLSPSLAPNPFPDVAFLPPPSQTLLQCSCLQLSPVPPLGVLAPFQPLCGVAMCVSSMNPILSFSSNSPPGGLCAPPPRMPSSIPHSRGLLTEPHLLQYTCYRCLITPHPPPAGLSPVALCPWHHAQLAVTGSVVRVMSVTAGPAWPRPPWGPLPNVAPGKGCWVSDQQAQLGPGPAIHRALDLDEPSDPRGLVCAVSLL